MVVVSRISGSPAATAWRANPSIKVSGESQAQPSASSHTTNGLAHHPMSLPVDGATLRASSVTAMNLQPVGMPDEDNTEGELPIRCWMQSAGCWCLTGTSSSTKFALDCRIKENYLHDRTCGNGGICLPTRLSIHLCAGGRVVGRLYKRLRMSSDSFGPAAMTPSCRAIWVL